MTGLGEAGGENASPGLGDDPQRALHFLVADALEALIPLVDAWAEEVKIHPLGEHARGYADGYRAGVQRMGAEVKDQLIERVLLLRR